MEAEAWVGRSPTRRPVGPPGRRRGFNGRSSTLKPNQMHDWVRVEATMTLNQNCVKVINQLLDLTQTSLSQFNVFKRLAQNSLL